MKLVVIQPFADYKVGDSITEAEQVTAVLESHPGSVVKTADDPKPEVQFLDEPARLALPVTSEPFAKTTRR